MTFGRFFRIDLAVMLASAVLYAVVWVLGGMGEHDLSAAGDVLIWVALAGFVASIVALVGGYITYVLRGT
jgi:hypothetical protein